MTGAVVIDSAFARELLAREMTQGSGALVDTGETEHAADAARIVASGERVLQRLNDHLVRWFGPEGVDALLIRSLDRTRKEHPILAAVQRRTPGSLRLIGIVASVSASVNTNGAANADPLHAAAASPQDVTDGIVALLATVLGLIGRLVGDDMARHIVRQAWPETASTKSSEASSETSLSNNGSNNERLGK